MTKEEIYNALHKIDVIADLETKPGVWYIENAGWTINAYKWIKDERTEEDQIYIHIKKK